jgi:pimeloyl-ACP methyl ester carboxylesterase
VVDAGNPGYEEDKMRSNVRPFRFKSYGEGPPLVLIPGLDGITEFFADIVPELSRFYRVVVYHLPLFSEARSQAKDYTFDFIAADLKQIMDELGIKKAHIIGESFGGVVSQVFYHRFSDRVGRLVLISTAPHFSLSLKNRLLLPIFPLIPMWLFARVHVHDVCEPDDPKWAKELFVKEATWADHASVVARARIVSRVDLRDKVSRIKAPTLLVVGGADRFTGDASRAMLKELPKGEMVEIPNAGHLCHMTDPGRFLGVVQSFLGRKEG